MATRGDNKGNNATPTALDLIDLHTPPSTVMATTGDNKAGITITTSLERDVESDVDKDPSRAATGTEGAEAMHLLQGNVQRRTSSLGAMATTRDARASSMATMASSGLSQPSKTYRPRYIHLPFTDYAVYFEYAGLFQKHDDKLTDDVKKKQAALLQKMSADQRRMFPILLRDYHNYNLLSFVDNEYRTDA